MSNYNCDPPPITERLTQKIKPELQDQDLKKCLNLVDLIIQGLAHIIGGGIFVMTPGVLALVAGPGLVFSYMIAAVVLLFTVLCYMDLGARYKGIGNAYVYVYASIGELGAGFVWVFMALELAIGEAMIAIGFGTNFDKFILNNTFDKIELELFSKFLPDMFADNVNSMAIGCLVVACVINCVGITQVLWFNTAVVFYAIFVLLGYFVISMLYGDMDTFASSTDPSTGLGGLFPYGIAGVIQGAAIVIISFAGFETIVTLSAESKEPKRDVPIAMLVSFLIAALIYITTAFAIAHLVPWYKIAEHTTTGIPYTLYYHNLIIPAYLAIAAVLLATASVVLCTLTTIARSLFKVALDGLFYKIFADVAECSKVPIIATICSTVFIIFITLLFSFEQLVALVSGGAILVFTIINFSLVVISYTTPAKQVDETTNLVSSDENEPATVVDGQEWQVAMWMGIYTILVIVICYLIHIPWTRAFFWTVQLPLIILCTLIATAILICIRCTFVLQTPKDQTFVCPFVPFTPAMGMFLNLLLFSYLSATAHYMAIIYIITGAILYFTYGYFNSNITVEKQKF